MRKKTQAEKSLSGTIRLDRTGTKRAKVVTTKKMPPPQKHLTRRAKKIYKEICLHLLKHDAICTIDSLHVSAVAQSYDTYQTMMEEMMKKEAVQPGEGFIKTHSTGATQISDLYVIAKNSLDYFTKGCTELGLSVKARGNILAFSKDTEAADKSDPIAEMIARKQARQAAQ